MKETRKQKKTHEDVKYSPQSSNAHQVEIKQSWRENSCELLPDEHITLHMWLGETNLIPDSEQIVLSYTTEAIESVLSRLP